MMGEAILALAEPQLRPVAEHMDRTVGEHAGGWPANPVVDAVRHSLRGHGKMLRAAVFLAACRAAGGDPDALESAASGIEYGHLASLVHDDLIDADTLRRDNATVWSRFGSSCAVLTGDWMLFAAFHALARCADLVPAERVVRALEALSHAGIDMCLGAAFELSLTGDVGITPETYLRMAAAKTGSLLRAAVASGTVLGGGPDEQVAAAGDYGEHLGVAFQIIDDLLPYLADEATLGKPVHSDLRNRRPTLPVVLALPDCRAEDRDLLRALYTTPAAEPGTPGAAGAGAVYRRVRHVLADTGALVRAGAMADRFVDAALAALDAFAPGAGRDQLAGIAAAVRDRHHALAAAGA